MKHLLSIALATLVALSTAQAHHGQDFLLLEDYFIPVPGSGNFTTNFEWESGDADEYGLTPSIMFGVLPRIALSVETDFRNEATTDWEYSSVTPMAHFQLTPPSSTFPIKFGFSAGYQFGDSSLEGAEENHHGEEAEHEHEHGDEHGEHHDEDEDEEGHHAEEEEEHSHSHSGSVHAHGLDAFVGRFIVEADLGANTKAIFNLLSVVTDDEAAWGYAAGVRQKISDKVAVGVEALGDFDSDGWHEVDVGAYYDPIHTLTLKLGAGFGLTDESPDFILRTGFIWRF